MPKQPGSERPLSEEMLEGMMVRALYTKELVLDGLEGRYPGHDMEPAFGNHVRRNEALLWEDRRKLVKALGILSGDVLVLVSRVQSKEQQEAEL